jgi:transcriptional regulator with XRE-family HTH domain
MAMAQHNEMSVAEQFATVFGQVKNSESYQIDYAKVEISEQIYQAMEAQGISKAELARRLGKSRAYLTKMLQGNVNFTIATLVKVAMALNCKFELAISLNCDTGIIEANWADMWKADSRRTVRSAAEFPKLKPFTAEPPRPIYQESYYESIPFAA